MKYELIIDDEQRDFLLTATREYLHSHRDSCFEVEVMTEAMLTDLVPDIINDLTS